MYLCELFYLFMKRFCVIIGLFCAFLMVSCSGTNSKNILIHRDFPTASWERFDFLTTSIDITKPTVYDIVMEVAFDPSYSYDNLTVIFTVFDSEEQPLRSKNYKFRVKDYEGAWKSNLEDGCYRFMIPINSELSLNEPGTYKLQVENRMPITPLTGIKEVSIINQK